MRYPVFDRAEHHMWMSRALGMFERDDVAYEELSRLFYLLNEAYWEEVDKRRQVLGHIQQLHDVHDRLKNKGGLLPCHVCGETRQAKCHCVHQSWTSSELLFAADLYANQRDYVEELETLVGRRRHNMAPELTLGITEYLLNLKHVLQFQRERCVEEMLARLTRVKESCDVGVLDADPARASVIESVEKHPKYTAVFAKRGTRAVHTLNNLSRSARIAAVQDAVYRHGSGVQRRRLRGMGWSDDCFESDLKRGAMRHGDHVCLSLPESVALLLPQKKMTRFRRLSAGRRYRFGFASQYEHVFITLQSFQASRVTYCHCQANQEDSELARLRHVQRTFALYHEQWQKDTVGGLRRLFHLKRNQLLKTAQQELVSAMQLALHQKCEIFSQWCALLRGDESRVSVDYDLFHGRGIDPSLVRENRAYVHTFLKALREELQQDYQQLDMYRGHSGALSGLLARVESSYQQVALSVEVDAVEALAASCESPVFDGVVADASVSLAEHGLPAPRESTPVALCSPVPTRAEGVDKVGGGGHPVLMPAAVKVRAPEAVVSLPPMPVAAIPADALRTVTVLRQRAGLLVEMGVSALEKYLDQYMRAAQTVMGEEACASVLGKNLDYLVEQYCAAILQTKDMAVLQARRQQLQLLATSMMRLDDRLCTKTDAVRRLSMRVNRKESLGKLHYLARSALPTGSKCLKDASDAHPDAAACYVAELASATPLPSAPKRGVTPPSVSVACNPQAFFSTRFCRVLADQGRYGYNSAEERVTVQSHMMPEVPAVKVSA